MIKAQQRLKIHKHNVCLEDINKIALATDDVKSTNIMHVLKKLTRLHWVLKMLKEYNKSIQQKHIHMEREKSYYIKKITLNVTIEAINYDFTTRENVDYNPNWPQIL